MPREYTVLQNEFPYHITGRCINKEWFNLPMGTVWKVFSEELYMTCIIHNLKVHSFVLMSNHYHLIAHTPDKNLSKCMQRFLLNTSLRLTKLGNRINQTFAGRYFKTIIQQPNYYLNCYKYVYRNPIEAGLSEKAELYPYSTLSQKLGLNTLSVPIIYDDTLFEGPSKVVEQTLEWINTKPSSKNWKATNSALRKRYFQYPKCMSTNKPLLNEEDLI